ncbi:hypothetical protein D3C87_1694270 [compost metagenome]
MHDGPHRVAAAVVADAQVRVRLADLAIERAALEQLQGLLTQLDALLELAEAVLGVAHLREQRGPLELRLGGQRVMALLEAVECRLVLALALQGVALAAKHVCPCARGRRESERRLQGGEGRVVLAQRGQDLAEQPVDLPLRRGVQVLDLLHDLGGALQVGP